MNRRTFLSALAAVQAVGALRPWDAAADLPKAKVTRSRIYRPPNLNPLFNQSDMVVTVETDIGITGLGEGGTKDTLEQCAGTLIGKNPFKIDAIWQEAYIAWFYPPGREKTTRWGRSTWLSGTSRARRSTSRCTSCSGAPRATTASATSRAASARPACRRARA
jgi:galactonate dehydratase